MGRGALTIVNGGNIFANATYGQEVFWPWVLTQFSAVSSTSNGSGSYTFKSYTRSVTYAGFSLNDIRLNRAGENGLSVDVYQGNNLVDSYVISDFVQGRQIAGFGRASTGGSFEFGEVPEGEPISSNSSSSPGSVSYVVGANGAYDTFTATTAYRYFFQGFTIGGVAVNLRGGVRMPGGPDGDAITGFDFDPSTGSYFNDTLLGLGGDDTLDGKQGADNMIGGDGSDTLTGGGGFADSFDGGAGTDIAMLNHSGQTTPLVAVNGGEAGIAYTITIGGAAAGSFVDIEEMEITGGAGDDRIGGVFRGDGYLDGRGGTDVGVVDFSASTAAVSGGVGTSIQSGNVSITIAAIEALDFTGGSGSDDVTGGIGGDTLRGALGNDTLNAGRGNNVVDGGSGIDFAAFDFSDRLGTVVAVNGAVAGVIYQITAGGAAAGSMTNLESAEFIGGAGNDRLGGVLGNESYLTGGGGTDVAVIDGSVSTSAISGSLNNWIYSAAFSVYSSGFEALDFTGGSGADEIDGGVANDTLRGGLGNDTLRAGRGDNIVDGGSGADLAGFDFSDRTASVVAVNGGVGGTVYAITVGGVAAGSMTYVEAVEIVGGSAGDRIGGVFRAGGALYGGGGTDIGVVDLSAQTTAIVGGIGYSSIDTNTISIELGGLEALDFTGGSGADDIMGGTAGDTLRGGLGNDTLRAGRGDNVVDGGSGTDFAAFDFSDRTASVLAVNGGVGGTIYGITVGGLAAGSMTFVEAVEIIGGSASDRIGGVFRASGGLFGGGGMDVGVVDLSAQTTAIVGGIGYPSLDVGAISIELNGIEALDFTGGSGADDIMGGSGDDTLRGGGGADTLAGGLGNDIYVDPAGDTIVEEAGQGIDTIVSSVARSLVPYAAIENLTLTGSAAIAGTGNTLANVITGNDGANALSGLDGNDTLTGGGGADTLTGGLGNDTYVDPTGDTIVEAANGGTDTVTSALTFSLETLATIERLFLTGPSAIDGTGNALANLLLGNDLANTLNGRDGDDTLNGGGGADTLNGGNGMDRLTGGLQRDKIVPGTDNVRDTVVYTLIGESTGQTRDVITGLDLNTEDKIDLPGPVSSISAARSGSLSLTTFNQNLASVFTAAALPTGSAALFTATSGDLANPAMVYLIVDANGIAGYQANQDWVFQLESHTGTLDITDFI